MSYTCRSSGPPTPEERNVQAVEDEFTRTCLAVEVEHQMNSRFVADTLMGLVAQHGAPRFVRSDNGPEFIARHLMRVFAVHGIEARHIDPGSPWQNGRCERFNGTLRAECLDMETFASRDHARMICKVYGRQYNAERPHSSLGYLTPGEFADRYAREHGGDLRGAVKDQAAGALPPGPRDLPPGTPPAGSQKNSGSSAVARPASRQAVRGGAPVASQQSRILRADGSSVAKPKGVRKVLARIMRLG